MGPKIKTDLALPLPGSGQEIRVLQRERKALAVENATRSRFWQSRLAHIDTSRLEDPEEWRKIPILDKEMLRSLSNDEFYNDFCIPAPGLIAEHWRSGGTTGRPLFYPRTFEDIRYAMVGFARNFVAMNVRPGETAHLSLPLGIHPAGHMWARAGEMMGIGMNWVGSGAAAPSELQLELIATLKPSLWIGMPSYGLHLANLAGARGQNLRDSSVKKILCTAEPLSRVKREKLERAWGAKVYDAFGMTEVSMMGSEGEARDGFHMWTDLAFIEVVDPDTREPVPPGEPGLLVVTSLFTNHVTPFLRWCSGDIVTCHEPRRDNDPLSVFPLLRHAHRTAGFFKIRGVNINHSELEDLMFADSDVNDFQAEALTIRDLDVLQLSIEIPRADDAESVVDRIRSMIKKTFELTPEIVVLEGGALAKEFEKSVKAPRFLDRRQ
jgi:phenylacetate-CoA ligase